MAWIESHQQLEKHPKVYDLMSLMGWQLDETIGKLHRFWWWCVDYAEDGDLRKHNDARLAMSVGLNGEESKIFIEAMVKSSWIDREPYFRVHDWWEYIGRFLQVKYKHNPIHWKKIQKAYKNRSKNRSSNCIPNLTKPNLTKPYIYTLHFENLWKQYPNKVEKRKALAEFKKSVKTKEDLQAIEKAIANYQDMLTREDWRKPKDGCRFFREDFWRSWVDYKKPKAPITAKEFMAKVRKEAENVAKSEQCAI